MGNQTTHTIPQRQTRPVDMAIPATVPHSTVTSTSSFAHQHHGHGTYAFGSFPSVHGSSYIQPSRSHANANAGFVVPNTMSRGGMNQAHTTPLNGYGVEQANDHGSNVPSPSDGDCYASRQRAIKLSQQQSQQQQQAYQYRSNNNSGSSTPLEAPGSPWSSTANTPNTGPGHLAMNHAGYPFPGFTPMQDFQSLNQPSQGMSSSVPTMSRLGTIETMPAQRHHESVTADERYWNSVANALTQSTGLNNQSESMSTGMDPMSPEFAALFNSAHGATMSDEQTAKTMRGLAGAKPPSHPGGGARGKSFQGSSKTRTKYTEYPHQQPPSPPSTLAVSASLPSSQSLLTRKLQAQHEAFSMANQSGHRTIRPVASATRPHPTGSSQSPRQSDLVMGTRGHEMFGRTGRVDVQSTGPVNISKPSVAGSSQTSAVPRSLDASVHSGIMSQAEMNQRRRSEKVSSKR